MVMHMMTSYSVGIYFFRVNNGNTRRMCLTPGVFIVNFEQILNIVLVFLLLTLTLLFYCGQVNAGWVGLEVE